MTSRNDTIALTEMKDVVTALDQLTIAEAKQLFFHLGVPLGTLDDIDAVNLANMRKIRYVQVWYDNETDATWDKIIAGLKEIQMMALAESLARQKTTLGPGPTSDTPSTPQAQADGGQSLCDHSLHLIAPPPPPPPPPPLLCSRRVDQVRVKITGIRGKYINLVSDTQSEMTQKENLNPEFVRLVVDHLLILPVAQRALHVMFFRDSEDDLLGAGNVRKLITILKRYCNHFNYEIFQVVVLNFCEVALQHRMQEYCQSLELFERGTTVDVYLEAISASPVLSSKFRKMAVTINKPANQCTLYEVRKLTEDIAEGASLQAHSVFIGGISKSSVRVELGFPASCVGWILGVMTTDFIASHHISFVGLDQDELTNVARAIEELTAELIVASQSGDVVRVASLLNSGANVQGIDEEESPLIWASLNGHLDIIRLLASRGAQLDHQEEETEELSSTALMVAAESGQRDAVKELISLGASLDLQNIYGDSAVMAAIMECQPDTLKELVEAGSNLDLQSQEGLTALMLAVKCGESKLIQILLDEGEHIDLDIQENDGGCTALHLCAGNGDALTTRTLVRVGANVHIQNKNGWTALEIARVKSVDKDTEVIPKWSEYHTLPYVGERNYETVIELLRGSIHASTFETQVAVCKMNEKGLKGGEDDDVLLKDVVLKDVVLKGEWTRLGMEETRLSVENDN